MYRQKTDPYYFFNEDLLFEGERHPVTFNDRHITNGNMNHQVAQCFEQGSCYDLTRRQTVNVSECRSIYNQGMKEMSISEDIILGNWLKDKQ